MHAEPSSAMCCISLPSLQSTANFLFPLLRSFSPFLSLSLYPLLRSSDPHSFIHSLPLSSVNIQLAQSFLSVKIILPSPSILSFHLPLSFLPSLHLLSFKHAVGPIFSISDPTTREGEQLVVRLSAPILTRSFALAFTGKIEVDITAEDLPAEDTRLRATLGKHCLILSETQIY